MSKYPFKWLVCLLIQYGLFQKQDNKPTMWSNSRVDISLDSLKPTLKSDKPQSPSMNQLLSQKPGQTPYNSPQQVGVAGVGSGGYNLGSMQMSHPGQMNYMNQSNMMSNQGRVSPNMMNMPGGLLNTPMGGTASIYGSQPMGMRPMSSQQGFSTSSFSTYKGIS